MSQAKVLLVGYNGANNTGAEALLLSDIEDVRAVLGPDALITVPSLNESNLRRYVQEGPNLRIVAIPTIFPLALRQLVAEHDLIMLVKGHCYMEDFDLCVALGVSVGNSLRAHDGQAVPGVLSGCRAALSCKPATRPPRGQQDGSHHHPFAGSGRPSPRVRGHRTDLSSGR